MVVEKKVEGLRSTAEKLQDHSQVEAGWERMMQEGEPGCRMAAVQLSRQC